MVYHSFHLAANLCTLSHPCNYIFISSVSERRERDKAAKKAEKEAKKVC